ncbi:MAG: LamG domain-containing protein [Candidatus Zipacnadales bacterium]
MADGTVGALTLPDGPYLHFGTGEFSLSFWIKPDRYDLRVMGKERFPQTWWVINLLADGRLELVLGETQAEGKMVRPATRAPLPTDRWTHVACVVDRQNRQAKWYLNGTLDSTTEIPATLDGSLSVEGADLLIPSAYKTFVGLFDELRIYQKALSEAEIKAAYEAEQPTRTSVEYEATW